MKKCILVGASPLCGTIQWREGDFIIAVDGGYHHLKGQGISPHLVVGDLDSMEESCDLPISVLQFSAKKDDTDMMLALKHGIELGYDRVDIYGATGGRQDHFMGNLALLAFGTAKGIQCRLLDDTTEIQGLTKGKKIFPPQNKILSVFSFTNCATGVTIKGAEYPLKQATLDQTIPLGVSNGFLTEPVEISVKEGILFIFLTNLT